MLAFGGGRKGESKRRRDQAMGCRVGRTRRKRAYKSACGGGWSVVGGGVGD